MRHPRSEPIGSVGTYALLGRSGLRVSPLCLGTMTFGTEWGWGAPLQAARALFARYLEAGGNFIDTADGYTGGTSEEMEGGISSRILASGSRACSPRPRARASSVASAKSVSS